MNNTNKEIITDLLMRLYCDNIILYQYIYKEDLTQQIKKLQTNILAEGLLYGIDFMSFNNIIKYDRLEIYE